MERSYHLVERPWVVTEADADPHSPTGDPEIEEPAEPAEDIRADPPGSWVFSARATIERDRGIY